MLGHQIALVNYNNVTGDTPLEEDLVWMPGVGATTDVAGAVACDVIYLNATNYLTHWTALYNNLTGIFKSDLTFSDGEYVSYGLPGGIPPAGSRHFNRTLVYNYDTPVSGIWGFEDQN